MIKDKQKFTLPIIISILLHLAIVALLFIKLPQSNEKAPNNSPIINAVAISESQLSANKPAVTQPEPPVMVQNTIRRIEQSTLKQTQQTTKTAAPIQPAPKMETVKAEEMEAPTVEEPVLQHPKIDEAALALEKQKVQEEKKKAENKRKEALKKKEADAKKRREEVAKELQAAVDSEVSTVKTSKAQESEHDEVAPIDDSEATEDAAVQGEKKEVASSKGGNATGELDKYKQMIIQSISRKWIMPDIDDKSLACQLLVHVGPGGIVVSVDVVKESGNPTLDRSATNAVMKASPLPVPESTELFDNFRSLRLTFRPQGIVSG